MIKGLRPLFIMVIYLTHPVHGSKVAISDLEAIEDEKNGWVRPESIDEVRAKWQQKHGTKPHHKKSIETLRSEL